MKTSRKRVPVDRVARASDKLHRLGVAAYRKGEFEKAEQLILKAIRKAPATAHYYNDLGVIFKDRKQLDEALSCFRKAASLDSASPMICCNLAETFHRLNVFDDAEKHYCRAIRLKPDFLKASFNLAMLYHEQREFEKAISQYQAAIAINPGFADTYYYLGCAYHDLEKLDSAIHSYEKALCFNPDSFNTYNSMGTAWLALKKPNKALVCFDKALALDPASDAVLVNMGNAFQENGQYREALHAYRRALSLRPANEVAFLNLGITLMSLDKARKARACYQRAYRLNPRFVKACAYLVNRLYQDCEWKDLPALEAQLDRSTKSALADGKMPAETPFLNMFRRADPKLNMQVAAAWSNNLTRMKERQGVARLSRKANKSMIRVGYLSNTFSNHPGAHLISGIFRLHDRGAFEIYSFSYGVNDGSAYRARIEKESDRFFDIAHLSDQDAAALIQKQRVDILVDLRGLTHANRLSISALRPAPIHVFYLGYPGSTGADFIDYMIVDRVVAPKAHKPYFSENLVYMPHCYQVNDNTQKIADRQFQKSDFGIPEEAFAYCSFSTHYKIEPVMFDCWTKILTRVPNSVLCLLEAGETTQKNLKKEITRRGIEEDRLLFLEKMPKDEHLARLRALDLSLDTRICNGHTTTSDALWAGLPVLTLKGGHFASRVSASILQAMHMEELITEDLQDYENLAVKIGRDPELLESINQKIEANRLTAPLFDTPRFTKNLEWAYREMVRIHQNGEKPRSMEVRDVQQNDS